MSAYLLGDRVRLNLPNKTKDCHGAIGTVVRIGGGGKYPVVQLDDATITTAVAPTSLDQTGAKALGLEIKTKDDVLYPNYYAVDDELEPIIDAHILPGTKLIIKHTDGSEIEGVFVCLNNSPANMEYAILRVSIPHDFASGRTQRGLGNPENIAAAKKLNFNPSDDTYYFVRISSNALRYPHHKQAIPITSDTKPIAPNADTKPKEAFMPEPKQDTKLHSYKPGDRVFLKPVGQSYKPTTGTVIRLLSHSEPSSKVILVDQPNNGPNALEEYWSDMEAVKQLGLPTENRRTYYALPGEIEPIIDLESPPGTKALYRRGGVDVEATIVCKHAAGGLLVSVPAHTFGFKTLNAHNHIEAAKKLGLDPVNGYYAQVSSSLLKDLRPVLTAPPVEPAKPTEPVEPTPPKQEPALDPELTKFFLKLMKSLTPSSGPIAPGEILYIQVDDHIEEVVALCRYWTQDGRWVVRLPADSTAPPGFNDGLNGVHTTDERNSKLAPHRHIIKQQGYDPDEPRYCSVSERAIKGIRQEGTKVNVQGRTATFITASKGGIVIQYDDEKGMYNLDQLIKALGHGNEMISRAAKTIGLDTSRNGYDWIANGAFSWVDLPTVINASEEAEEAKESKPILWGLVLERGAKVIANGRNATYVCMHNIHPMCKDSNDIVVYYDEYALDMSSLSSDAHELRKQAIAIGLDPNVPQFGVVPLSAISAISSGIPDTIIIDSLGSLDDKHDTTPVEYDVGYLELEKGDIVKVQVKHSYTGEWHEREGVVITDVSSGNRVVLHLKEGFDCGETYDEEETFETACSKEIVAAKDLGIDLTNESVWFCNANDTKVIEKLGKHKKGVDLGGVLLGMGALVGAIIGHGLNAKTPAARVVVDNDVSSSSSDEAETPIEQEMNE
jgi:hypothetical protein